MIKITLIALLSASLLVCPIFAMGPPSNTLASQLPSAKVNTKDNAEMVLIPAGKFQMGTSIKQLATLLKSNPSSKREWYISELTDKKVDIDAFYMYKNEVTVAQYRKFCDDTHRSMPTEPPWKWQDNHPIVNVNWNDAKAYADWAGATLPTEAQWEKAARGTDGRAFPWGSKWDTTKCCNPIGKENPEKSTSQVGSYPAGASPYGVMDMAGNVWEWCADWYDEGYYKISPLKNPTGPVSGSFRVLRGGSWRSDNPRYLRAIDRGYCGPVLKISYIGFRCAAPVDK